MIISNSRDLIRRIKKKPENFFIIHYSCQSLYDDNEGLLPRITSIAVIHFTTGQAVSFSTHAVAEELKIDRDEVRGRFDEIELKLLSNFYKFIRDKRDRFWVHWNMRNLTYGFEHIEHRYQVLGGSDAPVVPIEHRINLNDYLADRYGSRYAAHPKMKSLMELNGGPNRHFLTGEEEVNAFNSNEFIRMHNSTLCKAEFFKFVMKRLVDGRLRTKSKNIGVKLDRLFESRLAKGVGFVGACVGLIAIIWELIKFFEKNAAAVGVKQELRFFAKNNSLISYS